MTNYSIRTKPMSLAGEDGHWYEVRDAARHLIASGWSRGSKKVAQRDAHDAIAAYQAKQLAVAA